MNAPLSPAALHRTPTGTKRGLPVASPIPSLDEVEAEKFWRRVQKGDGCWLWTGPTDRRGYGDHRIGGRHVRAHRVAYEIANREAPGALLVCHACDNPTCVNPDHLFLGSHADNNADCIRKGRARPAKGEAHGKHRLTVELVREFRSSPLSNRALARLHGVSNTTVMRARNGQHWGHVE